MQPEELLAQVPLLAGLGPAARRALARELGTLEVPADETVVSQGEVGDTLFLIQEGAVQVSIQDTQGNQSILETIGAGQYFGEMALLDDRPRSATIVTAAASVLRTLSRAAFQDLVLHEPSVALSLVKELSRRLRACNARVADLALLDGFRRVGRFLTEYAVRDGAQEVLPRDWTVNRIASHLEIAAPLTGQVLRELEVEGYLASKDGRVVIRKHLLRAEELMGMLIW